MSRLITYKNKLYKTNKKKIRKREKNFEDFSAQYPMPNTNIQFKNSLDEE